MIKKIILVFALSGLIFMNACGNASNEAGNPNFWVMNFSSNSWDNISTKLRAENTHVKIYVDVNATSITQLAIDTLAGEFNTVIYPTVTTNFAEPYDADGNGKVTIVITDIKDNYEITDAYTGGYFNALDMYSQAQVDQVYPGKKSNEGDIIYIDCYPQDINSAAAGTIAHEFQHMVNFSKYLNSNTLTALTDTWIDEGFAEAATHMCYGENKDRIDFFNNNAGFDTRYIANGQSLFYWDSTDNTRNLMNYSLSYLFFQYLRSQSEKKDAIFRAILDTTNSVVNYQAIEEAMADDSNLSSDDWKPDPTVSRFNTLLLRWYATNTSEIGNTGFYCYDSEIITHPDLPLYSGGTSITLDSGAGIVKTMNTSTSVNTTGYVYLSVNNDGSSEDFSPTFSNNGYFIAVYTTYDTTGASNGTTSLPSPSILFSKSAASEKSTKNKIPMMRDPVFSKEYPLLEK